MLMVSLVFSSLLNRIHILKLIPTSCCTGNGCFFPSVDLIRLVDCLRFPIIMKSWFSSMLSAKNISLCLTFVPHPLTPKNWGCCPDSGVFTLRLYLSILFVVKCLPPAFSDYFWRWGFVIYCVDLWCRVFNLSFSSLSSSLQWTTIDYDVFPSTLW